MTRKLLTFSERSVSVSLYQPDFGSKSDTEWPNDDTEALWFGDTPQDMVITDPDVSFPVSWWFPDNLIHVLIPLCNMITPDSDRDDI